MSALDDLRHLQAGAALSPATIFDALFEAGSILSESDREADAALEIAIRLLEARRNGQVPVDAEQVIEFLAEECGLYPYVDPDNFSHLTQAVIEAHAVQLRDKLYLHSKQMQILLWLLQGDNVVLSAPTSFGKTLLIDAFIARARPRTVVVILPTIALIDEYRRRLRRTFQNDYEVITTVSEAYGRSRPTIFVLTQERFLQRRDELEIDLLVVDEFYKLDPNRGDTRFETLNLAVYRALPRARQCFMAGPHIREINLGERWTGSFRFVRTDYRTVTVNVIDRSAREERLQAFLSDLTQVGRESSLVFTATPNSAQSLMGEIRAAGLSYRTDLGSSIGTWIATNYHPDWPVAEGSSHGIAVHHGRLPRSLGQLFVHLFNEAEITVLICTSTLIEGVNTAAANVFIFDKKINRTDFDFFSFANIRGRVGRMMRHFVGNAFLYHEAPTEIETRVEVPVLADPGSSTDFLVMNVDRTELSTHGRQRQTELPLRTGLSPEILRDHGVIGADLLLDVYARVQELLGDDETLLIWFGFPNREQRKAIAELALMIAHRRQERSGLHTPGQIGWAWSQLRVIKTLPKFLRWFAGTFFQADKAAGVDAAFQFLQACEFGFPRSLAAVEALVRQARPGAEMSYGPYIAAMESWFRPAWLKELDESGIPLPLGERLAAYLSHPRDRADAIQQLEALDLNEIQALDGIDRFILHLATER
jgi:hypothetical protein